MGWLVSCFCFHFNFFNGFVYCFYYFLAESFAGKGPVIKGIRRHAKARIGKVEYKYCHYFVRLEEGPPPKNYYHQEKPSEELLEQWLENKRKRKIYRSL